MNEYLKDFTKNLPLTLSDTNSMEQLSLTRLLAVLMVVVILVTPAYVALYRPELLEPLKHYWDILVTFAEYLVSLIVIKKVNPWNPIGLTTTGQIQTDQSQTNQSQTMQNQNTQSQNMQSQNVQSQNTQSQTGRGSTSQLSETKNMVREGAQNV